MKVKASTHKIESIGLTDENETRQFSIKTDGHAFKILSSTIYTHKIRAIIRELTCNAWDAQQMSKQYDKDIDVHLPSTYEPYFSVKDYGTGLSDEHVMRLFSTYFDSTKGKSNNVIGAFGIGSKSPFSYVDSFTVESRFKGKKSIFTAYIGENGSPQITLMGTSDIEDPEELTGITIRMDVNNKDINEFHKEAEYVLGFFQNPSVKTNVSNLSALPTPFYSSVEGSCYYIGMSTNYCGLPRYGIFAKMGNVLYPIPDDILDREDESGEAFSYRLACNVNVTILDFKIGEFEVAPSREQISLTPASKKALVAKLHAFVDTLKKDFQDEVSACFYIEGLLPVYKKFDHFNISKPRFKGKKDIFVSYDTKIMSGYVRQKLNELSSAHGFYQEILEPVNKQHRGTPLKMATISNPKPFKTTPKYTNDSKVYWLPSAIVDTALARRKPEEINHTPKIVLFSGKDTVSGDSRKLQYYEKVWAKTEVRRVFKVRLPHYEDPSILRRFNSHIGHLKMSDAYIMFSELSMPTKEQLEAEGVIVDAVVAVKKEPKTSKRSINNVTHDSYGNLSRGSQVGSFNSPTEMQAYINNLTEKFYYFNETSDRAFLVGQGLGMQTLMNASKSEFLFLTQPHVKAIKDDTRFIHGSVKLKEELTELLTEKGTPYDFVTVRGEKIVLSNKFGVYLTFAPDMLSSIPNPNLVSFITLAYKVGTEIKKDVYSSYSNRDIKDLLTLAEKWGIPVDTKEVEAKKTRWQDDKNTLLTYFNKYPILNHLSRSNNSGLCPLGALSGYFDLIDNQQKRND